MKAITSLYSVLTLFFAACWPCAGQSSIGTAARPGVEVSVSGSNAMVRLHPTVAGTAYEILTRESLAVGNWRVEQQVTGGDGGTTAVVPMRGRPMLFLTVRAARPVFFRPAAETPCPSAVDAMLVMDVSHSLSAVDFDRAKAAGSNFVSRLDLMVDRVGLVSFAGDAYLDQALTTDGVRVQTNCLGLEMRSGTLLHPPIDLAQAQFVGSQPGVLRLIVLLSDGIINNNPEVNTNLAIQAAATATNAGTRIITVAYGTDAAGTNLMRRLASSDTDFYHSPDAAGLNALFTALADSICRAGEPVNQPPTVVLVSPTNGTFVPSPLALVPLQAVAADSDGTIAVLEIFAGAQSLANGAGTTLTSSWRPSSGGLFTLTARARDDDGAVTVSTPATITVNTGPAVNAGPDQSVTMMGTTPAVVTLAGSVSDDGFPAGRGLAVEWSVVGGPGFAAVEPDPAAPTDPARTRATFRRSGVYTLRLSASDSVLGVADDVRVTVLKANERPVVYAGPNQTIILPDPVYLPGAASDDGEPQSGALTTIWRGPAGVEIAKATATNTFARFSAPGVYLLSLSASDGLAAQGGLSSTQTARVTVLPANEPRVVRNADVLSAGVGGMRGVWKHSDPSWPVTSGWLTNAWAGAGELRLPGLNGPVKRAFLYWHGPLDVEDPFVNAGVTVNGRWVTGTPLSLAADNGWSYQEYQHRFGYSRAYRADVTALARTFGPGPYVLSNFTKAADVEINGASLVVFHDDGQEDNNQDFVLVEGNDSNGSLKFFAGTPVITLGSPSGFYDGVPAATHALALAPDGVFIAGRFMSVNATGRNGIARLRLDGGLDTVFAPTKGAAPIGNLLEGVVYQVHAVARHTGGRVILGGNFQSVEGLARTNLARLFQNGRLDTGFNPRVEGAVHALLVDGSGRILVGGDIIRVQNQSRRGLVRLLATGVLDTTFNADVQGTVKALALQPDGRIIAGGEFQTVNGQSRERVARLNADGSLDVAFNTPVWGEVEAVLVRGNGQIALGGRIVQVAGEQRTGLALLEADGSLNLAFNPDLSGTIEDFENFITLGYPHVRALVEHQGRILAGGRFIQANGQPRGRIARFLDDGAVDPAFEVVLGPDVAVPTSSQVEPDQTSIDAMVVQPDGKIIVGGCFEGFNRAHSARTVTRLNSDGSVDPTFAASDEGLSVTVPKLNYSSGPVSIELHVSDGQPARVVGIDPNDNPIWFPWADAPVHVNTAPWLLPTLVASGNGRTDDRQVFAGVSVPGAYWPATELAGLWDIVGGPVPAAALRPGLTSLRVHSGILPPLPFWGVPQEDAISLVAALARVPVGQTQPDAEPPVEPPSDQPVVAWPDRFTLGCGAARRILDVLGNDISPDGGMLRIRSVTQPAGGRCEVVREASAVLFVAGYGFAGTTAFNYTVMDHRGNEATASVTVTFQGTNRPGALVLGETRCGLLNPCLCPVIPNTTPPTPPTSPPTSPPPVSSPPPPSSPPLPSSQSPPAVSGLPGGSDPVEVPQVCTNSTRGGGQFACFYTFAAAAGDMVTLTLTTTNFLSHLYLRDPHGQLVASSAHAHYYIAPWQVDLDPVPFQLIRTNRLVTEVRLAGTYTVEVTTHTRGETGPYTIRLDIDSPTMPRLAVDVDGTPVPDGASVDIGLLLPGDQRTITVSNAGRVNIPLIDSIRLSASSPSATLYPNRLTELRPGGSAQLILDLGANPGAWQQTFQIDLGVPLSFRATLFGHGNPPGPGPFEVFQIDSPRSGAAFTSPSHVPVVVRVEPNDFFFPAAVELFVQSAGRQLRIGALNYPDDADFNRYTFLWRNAPEGVHRLVAQSMLHGHLSRTTPVTIEVRPPLPNRPPVASNDVFTVGRSSQGNVLRVLANDIDPNGDPLRVTTASAGGGTVAVAPDGSAVFYTPPPSVQGTDQILYDITDGRGGLSRAVAIVQVVVQSIHLVSPADQSAFRTNTAVPLRAVAATAGGALSRVEFLANGRLVAQAPAPVNGVFAADWYAPAAGHVTLAAVAVSSTGARLASGPVRVLIHENAAPPPPDTPPVAGIGNVSENQLIRDASFTVRGTARDDDGPVTYALNVLALADRSIIASVTGDGAVSDGPLDTLDFTLLRNGAYILELVVTEGFGEARVEVPFILDSQAKVGQLTFAEEDVVIPVGGFPIAVVRTYDSLNPNSSELGPAWTFALRDMEVEIDETREFRYRDPENPDPEDLLSLRVGGGRNVTLTLPDGRRTTFRFSLVPGPSDGGAPCFCYRAVWTPPPGVHATLEPLGESDRLQFIPWQETIGPFWAVTGPETPMDNFDFRGFVLTNADGTRFDLERPELGDVDLSFDDEEGPTAQFLQATVRGPAKLARITKRNGERIEFRAGGIDHFHAGLTTRTASVYFERDPADASRVIAVYAPDVLDAAGLPRPGELPSVRYEYYPAGDPTAGLLARVLRLVDRARGVAEAYEITEYRYANAAHPRLLTSTVMIDPFTGATREVRHEFDATGRWTGSADPAGRRTQLHHEPGSRREVIIDPLGRSTVHEYDPRGNVTRSVDPLGHVVTRAYDGQDNLLSETDPLGHVMSYGYDARGQRTFATNALGHVTRFTYDTFGNLLSSVDARGFTTANTYDAAGNLLSTRDAMGASNTFLYDARGQLVSQRDPLGLITTNRYDEAGRVFETRTLRSGGVTLYASRFSHDDLGRVLSESTDYTDALGQPRTVVTGHAYDERGRLVRTTNDFGGLNLITRQQYDGFGRLATSTDAAGRTSWFSYDTAGRRVQTWLEDEYENRLSISRTVFDDLNRPLYTQERVDVPGNFPTAWFPTTARATRHVYDEAGRLVRTERLRDVTVQPELQPDGSLGMRFLSAGPLLLDDEHFEYRGDPLLSAAGTAYDAAGRVTATTDARGSVTRYEYDALGLRTRVIDALGRTMTYAYDQNGNQTSVTDARGFTTTSVYDPLNRPFRRDLPDGTRHTTQYDALGRRVAETDPRNVTNRFGYDALGRLAAVTNAWATPDATWAIYAHDELGRQTAQTDALGRVTRYAYDALGRRTGRTLPGLQQEQFAYDPAGRLTAHTRFDGSGITNHYDGRGRLLSRHAASDGAILESFTYYADGQRASMTDASGVTTFRYDDAGRLTTNTSARGEIRYRHDDGGLLTNLLTSSADSRPVSYAYDALGRLTHVTDAPGAAPWQTQTLASYAYDAVGNLDTVTAGNGVAHRYRYDRMNRLTNLVVAVGALALAQFDYRLDAAGQRTNLVEQVNTVERQHAWRLDKLHRLTHETISSAGVPPATLAYAYDRVGNRLTRASDLAPLPAQSLSYDPNDRLTTDTYDALGNTTVGRGVLTAPSMTCLYDWANRLTNAVVGTKTIALTYNADGQRVKKVVTEPDPGGGDRVTTTTWLVDDRNPTGYAQVLEEHETRNTEPDPRSRFYVYGLDLLRQRRAEGEGVAGDTRYFGYDGHGSVRFLTDATGTVTDTYAYDAFGTLLAQTPDPGPQTPNFIPQSRYLYAGEEYDFDLNLYYNRARYLNPDTARFWSMDSYEGNSQDPLSLHKYLYAHANPANMLDPTGNFTMKDLMATVGTIATLAHQQLITIAQRAGPLFQAGGRHAWAARQAFGRFAENTAQQVIRLIQTSVHNLRIDENVQRGSRYIDFVLRHGQQVMDLEVKYKLPGRTGEALTRLVSQAQSSVAAGQGQTVIWTFKEPTLQELRLVMAEIGPLASNVQFVHGVEGLLQYIGHFFGF